MLFLPAVPVWLGATISWIAFAWEYGPTIVGMVKDIIKWIGTLNEQDAAKEMANLKSLRGDKRAKAKIKAMHARLKQRCEGAACPRP